MHMVKSRGIQRRHHVERVHPSKATLEADAPPDVLSTAGNVSYQECGEELRRLGLEMARLQNDLMAAKRVSDHTEVRRLGRVIQSLGQRRGPFRERRIHLLSAAEEHSLKSAIKELLPPDVQRRIWARANELQEDMLST